MNTMKANDALNQRIQENKSTSLYLLIATILFITLMVMAWTMPTAVHAQEQDAMLSGHLAPYNSANTILNVISDSAREREYGNIIIKLAIAGSQAEADINTGGKANFDSFNGVLSLAWKNISWLGETTVGVFGEGGSGSYDTDSALFSGGRIYGDGQVEHYGGGLFFHNLFSGNTYFEGSIRGGSLDNSYDVRDGGVKLNLSQAYYGAHLGLGQKMALTSCAELDLFLKGIWTRTAGKTVRVSAADRLRFDDIDSIRSRLGARLTQGFDDDLNLKGYIGAAWEYEFGGEAKAQYAAAVNNSKEKAELKGSTAFGEAGLIIDSADSIAAVDLGIFGLAGQRKGLGGTVSLKFEF